MHFLPLITLFFGIAVAGHREGGSNPTIVIAPGAWHSPIHFALVILQLELAGYDVQSIRLPGVDSSTPKDVSVTTDALFIRDQEIMPLLNEGKDVVLVLHSYAGSPGAAAAKGLSKAERTAAGQQGGVIGLFFIAALLAPTGVSLKQAFGGQFPSWVVVNETSGQLGYLNPQDIFYNDITNPVILDFAVNNLRPESENALSTGSPPPAWADSYFDNRRTYTHTLLDHAVPPSAQNALLSGTGVAFDVHNFNTSHSPFLSQPIELSQTILISIAGYVALG